MKLTQRLWVAFHVFNWLLILYFWFVNSGGLLSENWGSALVSVGRLAGLAAGYSVLTQFFLMGRSPLIERVFGLDKLARVHQTSGKLAFFFIVGHPLLLWAGYKVLTGVSWRFQFASLLNDFTRTTWALVAVALFVVAIAVAITLVRSRLRYELWYAVHLLVYIATFLAFWHQIEEGSDLLASNIFYYYWIALYIFVFLNQIVFRFARPFYYMYRHDFTVSRVERESPNVVSVYITGKDVEKFPVQPGQFMFFRFFKKGLWPQAHPFSLSMVPSGKELRITVKDVGDYTKRIPTLTPGTQVLIDGPYGVFTKRVSQSDKVLMIAGGIGITPIRSLSQQLCSQGKDVVLVYGNRTEGEIVFKREFESLDKLKTVHVLSDQQSYHGEKGRIDEEKLRRLVPDFRDREIYLCGPVPMMNGLLATLQKLGVPKTRIHFEKFAL